MKHISTRLIILGLGFLLIYVYDNWDYWFEAPQTPIGGNSGMTIPIDLVLNTVWIILWSVLLFAEQIFFWIKRNKDIEKKRGKSNVGLIIFGGIILVLYLVAELN